MAARVTYTVEEDINDYSVMAVPNDGRAPYRVAGYITDRRMAQKMADALNPRTLWAAYVGMAEGDGITLHTTKREALESCAEALGVPFNDPDDPQQVRDDEELADALDEESNGGSRDWCVEEVTIP